LSYTFITHSVCAMRALWPEGTLVRLIPPYVLAAPHGDAAIIMPTKSAVALIAAITKPQRVCQALAYAA